jgi:hypothetical protein
MPILQSGQEPRIAHVEVSNKRGFIWLSHGQRRVSQPRFSQHRVCVKLWENEDVIIGRAALGALMSYYDPAEFSCTDADGRDVEGRTVTV